METTARPNDLQTFLDAAKSGGVTDDSIVGVLTVAGWSRRRVYRGLADYYARLLGTPLPAVRRAGDDARDAFLYLLNFITLGFWTTSLGQVFYILIDHAFPDAAQWHGGLSLTTRLAWPLAATIVTFPVFAFVASRIGAELRARPDAALSGVRAWLTYAALVLAAIVVLVDAIWFLDAILRGELTIKFVLDSLVLLVLGGGVFAIYLRGLRQGGSAA